MDSLITYRMAAVLLFSLIYMLFDVFNRRNVPSIYAYLTLVVGLAFTVLYWNLLTIAESLAIACVVLGIGYVLYRMGQIGAADVIEFAAVSLIIPMQPATYFSNVPQLPLPFIISTFIATGFVALLLIPFYYLPRARNLLRGKLLSTVVRDDAMKGLMVLIAYLAFIAFLLYEIPGMSVIGLTILALLTVSSLITTVFERAITMSMVEYIPSGKFEEGDIVAINLMATKDVEATRKVVKNFDRLLTVRLINEMRSKKVKRKFPVYRSAMPLALPIFLGIAISLLFGNLILLVL